MPGIAHLWWIERRYTAKSGVALLPSGQAAAMFAAVQIKRGIIVCSSEIVTCSFKHNSTILAAVTHCCPESAVHYLQLGCNSRLQVQGNPQISEIN